MRRAVAWLLAALMGFSGGWALMNPDTVEDWILQQSSPQTSNHQELLGLQSTERWLVAVVAFPDAGPGSNDVNFAQQLLDQSAPDYLDQLSGGLSAVEIQVHPTIVMAPEPLAYYGGDINGRDTGSNGRFSPPDLARHVAEQIEDEVNWSLFDLNDDGHVDRFMVLHTSIGQEESADVTHRIWSHFTRFEDPIALSSGEVLGHYTMSSLKTGSSGVGTMLHETMHQMGALELYAVETDQSYQTWKGVGDWDIMASGNWNGGGRWPAIPTGATLDLIGANQTQQVVLEWPATSVSPCLGPTVELTPLSEGGKVLKVPLSNQEAVYIEWRNNSGFDSRLPGNGVLVTQLDKSVGDEDQNTVNTNPERPYVKVIEADGRNELIRGINSGEASDLFQNASSFGSHGIEIRDHDGVLVPWTARVTITNTTVDINFRADDCSPTFELNLPDHGSTLLNDESIPIVLTNAETCTSNLTSTDGRGALLNVESATIQFSSAGVANSEFTVVGTVTCDGRTMHLQHPVQLMNRIPVSKGYTGIISPSQETVINLELPSRGSGQQRLEVHIDGPLSRVASSSGDLVLDGNQTLEITITPNGLLSENMLVKGSVELETEDGATWAYPVELRASSADTWWQEVMTPGRVIGVALLIMGAYWAMAGIGQRRPKTQNTSVEEHPPAASAPVVANIEPTVHEVDPWGRPIDE